MEQKRGLVLCGCGWEESPWYIKDRGNGEYYCFGTSVCKYLGLNQLEVEEGK